MSKRTNIEWASHTGGPYLGCEPVSPGCANCYAWLLALTRLEPIFRAAYRKAGFDDWETRPVWGRTATRVLTKGFWKDARRINAQHAKAGTRGRWFPSMIDWLDEMPGGIIDQDGKQLKPIAVLADFLELVHECQSLDWLLLTKRPENWYPRINSAMEVFPLEHPMRYWLGGWRNDLEVPKNVWIGVSVEDQTRADERIQLMINIPAVVRFLSCEPLLGAADVAKWLVPDECGCGGYDPAFRNCIDWVIVGGESGPKARPMHPDWARSLRDQCTAAGVPFFFKQWGEWAPSRQEMEVRNRGTGDFSCVPIGQAFTRIGKKAAGRLLDGREWNEFPDSERLATA